MDNATAAKDSLQVQLIHFYDNFADYRDLSAFYYTGVASIAMQQESLDAWTVNGINRYAMLMQQTTQELDRQLKRLLQQAKPEGKTASGL